MKVLVVLAQPPLPEGGAPGRCAVALLLGKMVGTDAAARDLTLRQMAQIRDELAGPGASLLVRLVADRVVATWLHLHRLEGEYARLNEADTRRTAAQQSAISAVQKRYFAALDELVRIRNRPVRAAAVNAVREPEPAAPPTGAPPG